ncbi:MAG: DUF4203 domain-containing protein [Anaerolineales bacterium]|nr:DUF4203 domain-containing protein [Anaerolineales bacterium]
MTLSLLVNFIIGLAVLLFGRHLFWLFVAAAGFVFGVMVAPQLLPGQPDWLILLFGLVLGVVGALLALVLQQLAIALAGFIFGGYALLSLLQAVGVGVSPWEWLVFIVGGIIGAALVLSLFDPALIGLSALVGASLVVEAVRLSGMVALTPPLDLVLWVILFVVGIAVQAGLMLRHPPEQRRLRRKRTPRDT